MKTCIHCKQDKPKTTEFFPPDNRRPGGVQGPCKDCLKIVIEKRFDGKKLFLPVQGAGQGQEEIKFGQAKSCKHCGQRKAVELFYVSKHAKDGRRPTCISCWRVIHRRTPEKNRADREKNGDKIRAYDRERIKPKHKKLEKRNYDRLLRGRNEAVIKDAQLRRDFGITLEQYEQMHVQQNAACAICGTHQSFLNRKLCVDHCHDTGKVRQLLCNNCNRCLGLLKDDPIILIRAARYIKAHRG